MADRIKLLAEGLPVLPLAWALRRRADLWDKHTKRTAAATSPHHEVSDIWVRYAEGQPVEGPHESVWYPAAAALPVMPLVKQVMTGVAGERLGGILITRIAAGASVVPHIDEGWHARYYQKFAVQIEASPGQSFDFPTDDEALETKPGDLYWFDNAYLHGVTNDTPYERVTMILCIKPMEG